MVLGSHDSWMGFQSLCTSRFVSKMAGMSDCEAVCKPHSHLSVSMQLMHTSSHVSVTTAFRSFSRWVTVWCW